MFPKSAWRFLDKNMRKSCIRPKSAKRFSDKAYPQR
jgi:hypothetical protein